jgi:hypothetical protein
MTASRAWMVGRVVSALLALVGLAAPAHAAGADPQGRVLVGLGAAVRSFDTMSYADVRPVTHGESGGRIELGVRITGPWWASVAGHFSGAWFDYSSPDLGSSRPISGKIDDFSWLIRAGLEHHRVLSATTTLYVGAGAESGETRSWLEALNLSDEGPHVYVGGGYFKAGGMRSVWGPLHAYGEIAASSYHAHARRDRFLTTNNWLGRSLEGGIGVRLIFM